MVTKEEARSRVIAYLRGRWPDQAETWAVYEQVLEKPYGWLFSWDHKRYVEEKDKRSRLAGNGPILVAKSTGAIYQCGTAPPLDAHLERFERQIREEELAVAEMRHAKAM